MPSTHSGHKGPQELLPAYLFFPIHDVKEPCANEYQKDIHLCKPAQFSWTNHSLRFALYISAILNRVNLLLVRL